MMPAFLGGQQLGRATREAGAGSRAAEPGDLRKRRRSRTIMARAMEDAANKDAGAREGGGESDRATRDLQADLRDRIAEVRAALVRPSSAPRPRSSRPTSSARGGSSRTPRGAHRAAAPEAGTELERVAPGAEALSRQLAERAAAWQQFRRGGRGADGAPPGGRLASHRGAARSAHRGAPRELDRRVNSAEERLREASAEQALDRGRAHARVARGGARGSDRGCSGRARGGARPTGEGAQRGDRGRDSAARGGG